MEAQVSIIPFFRGWINVVSSDFQIDDFGVEPMILKTVAAQTKHTKSMLLDINKHPLIVN